VPGAAVDGVVPVAPTTGAPAAARFVDDGGAAGVRPAIATACGVESAEGSLGVAERATADESFGASSFFHQAKRGPLAQPVAATKTATNVKDGSDVRFILDGNPMHFGEQLARTQTMAERIARGAATERIFGIADL